MHHGHHQNAHKLITIYFSISDCLIAKYKLKVVEKNAMEKSQI